MADPGRGPDGPWPPPLPGKKKIKKKETKKKKKGDKKKKKKGEKGEKKGATFEGYEDLTPRGWGGAPIP